MEKICEEDDNAQVLAQQWLRHCSQAKIGNDCAETRFRQIKLCQHEVHISSSSIACRGNKTYAQ